MCVGLVEYVWVYVGMCGCMFVSRCGWVRLWL